MIHNRTYLVPRDRVDALGGLLPAIGEQIGTEPLRWSVTRATDDVLVVEATTAEPGDWLPLPQRRHTVPTSNDVVVSLVPTGIGCEIGGYAGDAAPATALLGASADLLVTNPNAVNASNFIGGGDTVVYTEGACIDLFSRGAVNLHVPRANRVGLIIERADDGAIEEVVHIANTVRAVHGVDIVDVSVTSEPVVTRCVRNASGAYVGTVDRSDVLLHAADGLLRRGASAIAVTTNVRDLTADDYTDHFLGRHPNPVGGAEAIVSHLIVRTFGVPAAHAPMVNFKDVSLPHGLVDPRGAGEYVSASGVACVLIGLQRAPQIRDDVAVPAGCVITTEDIVAVVAPASALGSVPVLAAAHRRTPVIAVSQNRTILDVTADALGLTGVIEVGSYLEAAGAVLALRNGVSLSAVRRRLRPLSVDGWPRVAGDADRPAAQRLSIGS